MKSAFWPTITISPSYISLCKLDDARKRDEERWETHVGEGEHVQGKPEERACTCPASPARATHPIVNRAYGLRLSSFTTTQENWEHCWEASNGAVELPWPCIYILQVLKRERGGERGKERERVKEIESSSGQSLKSTLPHMRKQSKQFKFWCVEKTMPFLMQTSSEKKREQIVKFIQSKINVICVCSSPLSLHRSEKHSPIIFGLHCRSHNQSTAQVADDVGGKKTSKCVYKLIDLTLSLTVRQASESYSYRFD